MFQIRSAHRQAWEKAAREEFEQEMLEHLKGFAPRPCEAAGEQGVRRIIRTGLERAARYRFTNCGSARFYIELMFLLGSDFDTDPLLPWAAPILNDRRDRDQLERADRLHDELRAYLAAVVGPNGAYLEAALRRIDRESLIGLQAPGGSAEGGMVQRLLTLYPEKCAYAGDRTLRALVGRGRELAQQNLLFTEEGVALVVGLQFLFGHGCATDPQYPWVGMSLKECGVGDTHQGVERLFAKLMSHLEQSLSGLKRR
jgi:hypothetical protein